MSLSDEKEVQKLLFEVYVGQGERDLCSHRQNPGWLPLRGHLRLHWGLLVIIQLFPNTIPPLPDYLKEETWD